MSHNPIVLEKMIDRGQQIDLFSDECKKKDFKISEMKLGTAVSRLKDLSEVKDLQEISSLENSLNEYMKEYIRGRFNIVGGTARLMFTRSESDAQSYLNNMLQCVSSNRANQLIEGRMRDSFVDLLGSMYCDGNDYENVISTVISKYVMRRLCEFSLGVKGMINLFERCQRLENDHLTEWTFEECVHNVLSRRNEGNAWKCDLVKIDNQEKKIERWYAKNSVWMAVKECMALFEDSSGWLKFNFYEYEVFPIYIRPQSFQFKTLDGILLMKDSEDGKVIITSLQMTVGETHKVDESWLCDIAGMIEGLLNNSEFDMCHTIRHVGVLLEQDGFKFRRKGRCKPTWSVEYYRCYFPKDAFKREH